jgi:hypothetical protein
MSDLSPKSKAVLEKLRGSIESSARMFDGKWFGCVYLDNAVPKGMSRRAFAGHLSALEAAGLYHKESDPEYAKIFGYVLDDKPLDALEPKLSRWDV